jgi:hypothetical protein
MTRTPFIADRPPSTGWRFSLLDANFKRWRQKRKEVISMRLSQLLSLILAKTPLTVEVPDSENAQLETPESLFSVDLHHKIGDIVADACRKVGLTERGSIGFGEFVAKLATGWSTRYSNETDILALDAEFGRAAYGSPTQVIRLYLLPTWDALTEHLPNIQRGVAAAFEDAKLL